MSDVSRRDLLRGAGAAVLAGSLPLADAQHVHTLAADEKASGGAYTPKAFTPHEWQTLTKLAGYIVPADDVSPGAVAAGAPDFIDLLSSQNPRMLAIYTGGTLWLDGECERRYNAKFIDAQPAQQTEILDLIAYAKNASPELSPGIDFLTWARNMVVDAFYTSPMGIKDLGYLGNTAVAKFEVPPNALEYALKRSGLG